MAPIRDSKDRVRVVIGVRKKVAFVTDNWRILPYRYHIKKKAWRAVHSICGGCLS